MAGKPQGTLTIGAVPTAISLAARFSAMLHLRHERQYTEHFFLLRKARQAHSEHMQIEPKMTWAEAARLPLCLLTRERHN